jgi:hypothetical protein
MPNRPLCWQVSGSRNPPQGTVTPICSGADSKNARLEALPEDRRFDLSGRSISPFQTPTTVFGRTTPSSASSFRRSIRRMDKANSVFNCAVFFASPPIAHLHVPELFLAHARRMPHLGTDAGLGLVQPLAIARGFCSPSLAPTSPVVRNRLTASLEGPSNRPWSACDAHLYRAQSNCACVKPSSLACLHCPSIRKSIATLPSVLM